MYVPKCDYYSKGSNVLTKQMFYPLDYWLISKVPCINVIKLGTDFSVCVVVIVHYKLIMSVVEMI